MTEAEWNRRVSELAEAPYKPFERGECPVTQKPEQLCPVSGLSLDGMASMVRKGKLVVGIGWGLLRVVGFETRFHSNRVSNVTFRTLPPGFTKGNMLVCFSDDELWMKNLDSLSGNVEFAGQTRAVKNLWRDFLDENLRNIEPVYLPPCDEDDEWFSFSAEARVNGRWYSVRPPTAAGCVLDVPNFASEEPPTGMGGASPELPCEIPVAFRDFDYLYSQRLLAGKDVPPGEAFSWLAENFFGLHGKPTAVSRLLEQGAGLSEDEYRSYVEAGHGFLGVLKGERERFGVLASIPQMELRDVAGGTAS